MMKLVILVLAAFVTSTISGILGMAGGILLLAVMFSVMEEHLDVIPLHGAVQLLSNGSRSLAFLKHVDWRTVARFTVGTIPGLALGFLLLRTIGEMPGSKPYLRTVIGLYILVAAYLPKPEKHAGRMVWYDFPLIGFFTGAAALIVGATGPLIAPLFARRDFVKERLVATKATCQMVTHFEKLPVFISLGIDYRKFGILLVGMGVAAVAGTLTGRRLIRHVSPELFVKLYKIALGLAGLKVLLWDGIWGIIRQSTGG